MFWEKLYDQLEAELGFDRNRVYAAGNSSGAWIANELGCKYAGDKKRPLRAPLANDTAQFENYPIGGGNADDVCKRIKGCPADYPLVVCCAPLGASSPAGSGVRSVEPPAARPILAVCTVE